MISLWIWLAALEAQILINEVLYDPSGSDGPLEWIELCNNGPDDIDIGGWEIESAGANWSESWTFSVGTLVPAGGHYAFGPGMGASSNFSPNLPNSGSDVDGIRLITNTDVVQDTLLYGSTNSNSLLNDDGDSSGPFAADVSGGNALARHTDCTEVSNRGDDFVETETLTPGTTNVTPVVEVCDNDVLIGVVINEVLYNPSSSDSGHEWVEIYNSTADDVDVSGWTLQAGTSSFSSKGSFPSGTVLAAGEYLLVGEDEVEADLGRAPDLITSLSLGNGGSSIDGVRLVDCANVVIDTVLYGDSVFVEEGWSDDGSSNPSSFAPEVSDGQAIGRIPNGNDSNLSEYDFQIMEFTSPWNANDGERVCDGQNSIKINEFLPNPHQILSDGSEISDDEGAEWVELYNDSDQSVSLSGWTLQWGGNPSYSGGTYALPDDSVVEAYGYFLIGGEYVENADAIVPLDSDLDMTLASSNADAVRLLHCGPGVADTVIYGPNTDGVANNPDELTDDTEEVATSAAPKPSEGLSIGRMLDGLDSDQSGMDFAISGVNTPGSSNPEIICGSGDFQVKINEIFPNPDGSDSGYEWIELYNAGTETVRMDSWSIQTASSSWSTKLELPFSTEIAPGQYFLIGEDEVPSEFADYTMDGTLSLGNASTGLDGVRLINCLGDIEDTLLYGEAGAIPSESEDPFEDDSGNATFVVFPESGNSIGRFPDGQDSDDNGVDFQTNMLPTPGQMNMEGDDGDPSAGNPSEQGCKNNQAPEDDAEPSKCSHVSKVPSMFWAFLVFVLIRRRNVTNL